MSLRLPLAAFALTVLLSGCGPRSHAAAAPAPETARTRAPVATRGPDDGMPFGARAADLRSAPTAAPASPAAPGASSGAAATRPQAPDTALDPPAR